MDLRDFETTSTYAIEAVYRDYYNLIPEKYRIKDKVVEEHTNPTNKTQKHPMSYRDVEKKGALSDSEYFYSDDYESPYDLEPFFDPELSFSDRLHYKLTNVDYPKRATPWFVLTWNCGKGILKSSLSSRRFQTATCKDDEGKPFHFKFMNVDMDITMCYTSNSMQALFELQENIIVGRRLKAVVYTRPHTILGSFPVSIDVIDSDINKYSRDKGTLCNLMLSIKVDYPIIGMLEKQGLGVIETINKDIFKLDVIPENSIQESHDTITEDTIIHEDLL